MWQWFNDFKCWLGFHRLEHYYTDNSGDTYLCINCLRLIKDENEEDEAF